MLLEFSRRQVIESGVTAEWVIETLDIAENIGFSLPPGPIVLFFNLLTFKRTEEAFSNRIVITVSGSAHAYAGIVISKHTSV